MERRFLMFQKEQNLKIQLEQLEERYRKTLNLFEESQEELNRLRNLMEDHIPYPIPIWKVLLSFLEENEDDIKTSQFRYFETESKGKYLLSIQISDRQLNAYSGSSGQGGLLTKWNEYRNDPLKVSEFIDPSEVLRRFKDYLSSSNSSRGISDSPFKILEKNPSQELQEE